MSKETITKCDLCEGRITPKIDHMTVELYIPIDSPVSYGRQGVTKNLDVHLTCITSESGHAKLDTIVRELVVDAKVVLDEIIEEERRRKLEHEDQRAFTLPTV